MQVPVGALPPVHSSDFASYSVEFSPYDPNLLTVATSQYFGIIGNGRQVVLRVDPATNCMAEVRSFLTQDGLYDCAWNEMNEHQVVSASGDGSVKLWDVTSRDNFPIRRYHEHTQEVSGVDWNLVTKQHFVTASWDNTIKLWDPNNMRSLRRIFYETINC